MLLISPEINVLSSVALSQTLHFENVATVVDLLLLGST